MDPRADPRRAVVAPPAAARGAWFDLRRWTAFSDDRARRAAYVLVCSETDRARLSAAHVLVVPNGYERPPNP